RKTEQRVPNIISSENEKKVDVRIMQAHRQNAAHFTFGLDRKIPQLYRAMGECMANTHDHAANQPAQKKWWLTSYHDEGSRITQFSFTDIGRGIFQSLKLKPHLKVYRKIGVTDNSQILKQILEKKIPSSTGLPFRGKGLPAIFKAYNRGDIRKLVIISNDAHIDLDAGIQRKINPPFRGTFLYWEIRP
ncbi:MAG TPA: hypothetical protein VJ044_15860, partial [Candidatus Hodarchaeales archaeon]|nr:hypothetical protein [Candidatus Hodarchaeales archaeon]